MLHFSLRCLLSIDDIGHDLLFQGAVSQAKMVLHVQSPLVDFLFLLDKSFVEITEGARNLKNAPLSRLYCCLKHLPGLKRHQRGVYGGLIGLVEGL